MNLFYNEFLHSSINLLVLLLIWEKVTFAGMQSSICSGYSEATCYRLARLFSKMVRVQSVFEPGPTPTGLKRNFMIMKVIAEEGEVAKCIKKLNNCFWKGGTWC